MLFDLGYWFIVINIVKTFRINYWTPMSCIRKQDKTKHTN